MGNITVGQMEYDKVDFPYEIRSGGLHPCIAIGIYDEEKKCAYLMHESNAHANGDVPKFLDYVLSQSNKQALKVLITGAGIYDEESNDDREYLQESKDYVTAIINKYFDSNVTFDWFPPNKCGELIVQTNPFEFIVELDD